MFTKRFLSCFLFLATSLGMFAQPFYVPDAGLQLWCGFSGTLTGAEIGPSDLVVTPNTEVELAMDRLGESSGGTFIRFQSRLRND